MFMYIPLPGMTTFLVLVFLSLKKHKLTLGLLKCYVCFSTIKYLGLKLGQNIMYLNSEKVKVLLNLEVPQTKPNYDLS